MKRRCAASPGFTLLELLIAITLLGLVVVIVVQAMRLGIRSIEAGDRKVVALERERTSMSLIQSQLQSAFTVAPAPGSSLDEQPLQFRGEGGSIEFRSYHSLWGGTKGPVVVTYRIVDDLLGKKSLQLTETPFLMEANREALLVDRADAITFEFYYKGPTDERGQWIEQWDTTDQLPSKVRLKITRDNRSTVAIIPLRLAKVTQTTTTTAPAGPK